jgi:hypothetical protein
MQNARSFALLRCPQDDISFVMEDLNGATKIHSVKFLSMRRSGISHRMATVT